MNKITNKNNMLILSIWYNDKGYQNIDYEIHIPA